MQATSPQAIPRPDSPPEETCPHCQQWEGAAEDTYCGFCGRLLIRLSVRPERVPLISGIAPQHILVFSNSGSRPFRVRIVPVGRPFRAVAFDPAEFDLPANRKAGARARLDETLLPEDFVARRLEYRCEIDGDQRKSFPFEVAIKSGPRPYLAAARLNFGGLEEGARAERRIMLGNRGGVPLALTEVRAEGSSQLSVAEGIPDRVMPGEKQAIDVVWDTTLEETETGGKAGFRLAFGNCDETPFVEAEATVFRRQLGIEPSEIHLRQVLVKHVHVERIRLKNQGTVDLEVVKIESDQAWIEVTSEKDRVSLPAGSSYSFELVLQPQDLDAGSHSGMVKVFTSDREEPDLLEVRLTVLHHERYDDYIGIDFGTTNSVVALWNPSGEQDIQLVKDHDSPLIPSLLVFLSGVNSFVTGFEARNQAGVSPEKAVRSIKRVMGAKNEHHFFDQKFSPEALATLIIKSLIERAERLLFDLSGRYLDVRKAIITVPANFFDLQIRGILKACASAGIDTEEEQARAAIEALDQTLPGHAAKAGIIIDEPSAAALFYLSHLETQDTADDLFRRIGSEKGLHAVIYDHGGGTLDISVAHVRKLQGEQIGITVLANRGDNRVGGESIDLALMKHLLKKCRDVFDTFDDSLISAPLRDLEARRKTQAWDVTTWERIKAARNQWKDTAEEAKIELSTQPEVRFKMFGIGILDRNGNHLKDKKTGRAVLFETQVAVKDLNGAAAGELKRSEKVLREALEVTGLTPTDVDYVFHTGRQSLMPAVRDKVREVFPGLPEEHDRLDKEHLKVCVAKGAVIYGTVKSGMAAADAGVVFVDDGRKLPHSYGVERIVGIAQRRFEVIVPKGTVYPARQEKTYNPEEIPADGWLNLKIYENTGTKVEIVKNPDIRQIGQINIDTMADKIPGCDVVFAIDANRQLQVLADEKEVKIEPESMEDEEGWMW